MLKAALFIMLLTINTSLWCWIVVLNLKTMQIQLKKLIFHKIYLRGEIRSVLTKVLCIYEKESAPIGPIYFDVHILI